MVCAPLQLNARVPSNLLARLGSRSGSTACYRRARQLNTTLIASVCKDVGLDGVPKKCVSLRESSKEHQARWQLLVFVKSIASAEEPEAESDCHRA